MSNMNDPVQREIVKARVYLLFRAPFFGNLALRLKLQEENTWVQTAATDGRTLYYNREFVKKLTREELAFLVGHEVLHCVFDHIGRRGTREPQLWNMAIDYIVNDCLVKNKVGSMIKGGLINPKYTDELSSEEVYNLLKKNNVKIQTPLDQHLDSKKDQEKDKKKDKNKGSGEKDKDGDPQEGQEGQDEDGDGEGDSKSGNGTGEITANISGGDGNGPPTLTEQDLAEIRQEVKSALLSISQAVGAGNVPAGIRRLIQELVEPVMDWRELLEMHIKSAIKDDFTFNRINRRSWAIGRIGGRRIVLPGMKEQDTIDVMCAIDTSGSMSEGMLRDFLSEVKGIMQMFGQFKLKLLTFDTKVYDYTEYTEENIDEIDKYPMRGGGGTMFECVWDFMEANDLEPHRLVLFTDGYPCGSWGTEDYCSTLFVIHGDKNIRPPWGEYAYYLDHKKK